MERILNAKEMKRLTRVPHTQLEYIMQHCINTAITDSVCCISFKSIALEPDVVEQLQELGYICKVKPNVYGHHTLFIDWGDA